MYRVRRSPIQGFGVFATQDLSEGTLLGNYTGKLLKNLDEAAAHWRPGSAVYFWSLSSGEVILGQSNLRYMNHSCEPNVEALEVTVNGSLAIQLWTKLLVRKGQELVLDYNLSSEGADPADYRCLCGTRSCRGTLLGAEA